MLARMTRHIPSVVAVTLLLAACASAAAAQPDPRPRAVAIAEAIRRADYQGDRAALRRLHDEMKTLTTADARLGARLRYWQAFALWRRAQNGGTDSASADDIERDLAQARVEFEESLAFDPAFVEARIGVISCMGNLAALHAKEPDTLKTLVPPMLEMTKAALAAAPENPRLQWTVGPQRWWTPVERGGGQAAAIAAYEQGLRFARSPKNAKGDPLEPSWGEAELLMSLAWSSLNKTEPDPAAAEKYAREALALVPDWRYVRDVLLPQIEKAKAR